MQLDNITLVMHDFGGPIGFHFAIQNPQKIKRIVVMNSWLWSSREDPEFTRFSKVLKSPLLPFLYTYLNFSARYLLPASFGDNKLSSNIRKQFTKPFGKPSERKGALAFARSLLNDQEWFESLWLRRKAIMDKPILLVWGMKDQFIRPVYLEKFKSGFPKHKVLELATCGHFPQEEHPEEVIQSILDFISDSTP